MPGLRRSGPGGSGPGGCLVPGGTWSQWVPGPGGLVLGGVWSWGGAWSQGKSGPGGLPGGDPQMATAVGGMHPSGTHSCYYYLFTTAHYFNHTYRSGTINSKSFISKEFLQIKWKFEINYTL